MSQKQGKLWTKEVFDQKIAQEDQMLIKFYRQADCFQKWKFVSALFRQSGVLKTQLQCRDRFLNYLNPKLKPGKLSQEQIVKLFECYNEYGPQWSFFETKIKGRSQNKLKNMFYSLLRSLLRMFVKIGQKRKQCPYDIKFQKIRVNSLLDMYQGRKNYSKIQGFFKQCLQNIGYSIKRHKLQKYLNLHNTEDLKVIYSTIYEQQHQINERQSEERENIGSRYVSMNLVNNNSSEINNRQVQQIQQQVVATQIHTRNEPTYVNNLNGENINQNFYTIAGVSMPYQYFNPCFTFCFNFL